MSRQSLQAYWCFAKYMYLGKKRFYLNHLFLNLYSQKRVRYSNWDLYILFFLEYHDQSPCRFNWYKYTRCSSHIASSVVTCTSCGELRVLECFNVLIYNKPKVKMFAGSHITQFMAKNTNALFTGDHFMRS